MEINKVQDFHKKFGLPTGGTDIISFNQAVREFRVKFMQEELDEFRRAQIDHDQIGAFDALLDLAYVVYGTALFMGITPEQWAQGFEAVHKANMAKIRVSRVEESKRGSAFDVGKPDGWVGPESKLKEILNG